MIRRPTIAVVAGLAVAIGSLAGVPAGQAAEPGSTKVDALVDAPQSAKRAPGTKRVKPVPPDAAGIVPRSDYADGAVRRVASLTDAAAGPSADQSLVRGTVTQDLRAQRITASVTLGAAPGTNSVVYAFLGEWSGGTCESRAVIAGATNSADTAGMVGSRSVGVTRSRSGAVLTLTSGALSAIRAAEWDCAFARLTSTADSNPLSTLYANDLVTTYTPKLAINRGAPIQGNYRGKWTTVEMDLMNEGRADALGTKVTLSGAGLAFKPKTRRYGKMDDRSTEYFEKFRVRLKGNKPRTLRITLTAQGGHRATKTVKIVQKPKARKLPSLVGRYYWGHKPVRSDKGWDNVAVRFVNKRFARVGFKSKGSVNCKRASKVCKRYTYNKRTGIVRVTGLGRGRATTEGIKLGKQSYYPLTTPRPGSKMAVKLIHQNFSGFCGIYCNTWTEWLTMDRKGRFVRSRQTIGSLGPPGVGTVWGIVPGDQRGRYQVLKGGKIRFTFANGKKRVHTIGVEHDVRGKPSPAGAGLVLDDVNFYLD